MCLCVHWSLLAYNIQNWFETWTSFESHGRNNVLIMMDSCECIASWYMSRLKCDVLSCTRLYVGASYVLVHANVSLLVCLCVGVGVCVHVYVCVCVPLFCCPWSICMYERGKPRLLWDFYVGGKCGVIKTGDCKVSVFLSQSTESDLFSLKPCSQPLSNWSVDG